MPQVSTSAPKTKQTPQVDPARINFAPASDEELIGDLIAHQGRSWREFVDVRLTDLFASMSPLEVEIKKNDQNHRLLLNFKDYYFEEPKLSDAEACGTTRLTRRR